MNEWIDSLTESQQRALAFQSGIAGWVTYPLPKLILRLKDSKRTKEIYEEHYGKGSKVQK